MLGRRVLAAERGGFFAITSATYAPFHAIDRNIFWTSRHFRLKLLHSGSHEGARTFEVRRRRKDEPDKNAKSNFFAS